MDLASVSAENDTGSRQTAFVNRNCNRFNRWLLPEYDALVTETKINQTGYRLADIKDFTWRQIRSRKAILTIALQAIGLKEIEDILFVSVSEPGLQDGEGLLKSLPARVEMRFSASLNQLLGAFFVRRRPLPSEARAIEETYLPVYLRENDLAQRMLVLPQYIGFALIGGLAQARELIMLNRSFAQGFRFYGTLRTDPRTYVVLVA